MIRIPNLTGGLNFRDMGGYSTIDGRTVRWQRLYRSGTTHAMTPEDISILDAAGIRCAFDLRSTQERLRFPNRLTEIANISYRFHDHDHVSGDITRLLNSSGVRPEQAHATMIEVYRRLPYEFEDSFRSLFRCLAQGEVPLVFNCTAGKDRTGVAAALVLTSLGVPRATILEDYLLSTQFFARICDMILNERTMALFGTADRAIWLPLMRVHPDYFNAMFTELEESSGSVERYLTDRLGLDPTTIARIRSHLLE